MRIRLSDARRTELLGTVVRFFEQELDEEISAFNAERLLDFFIKALGAPVYNQAIADARGFIAEKLTDLDYELYEPEEPTTGR